MNSINTHRYRLVIILLMWSNTIVAGDQITVSVTGEIIASACVVNIDSRNQLIDFGQLFSANFPRIGDGSPWKQFTLSLSRCPRSITQAIVTFHGQEDSINRAMFKNNGTAAGIALQIADEKYSYVNGSQKKITIDTNQSIVNFPFFARIYNTTGQVKSGSIDTLIQVTFSYH